MWEATSCRSPGAYFEILPLQAGGLLYFARPSAVIDFPPTRSGSTFGTLPSDSCPVRSVAGGADEPPHTMGFHPTGSDHAFGTPGQG